MVLSFFLTFAPVDPLLTVRELVLVLVVVERLCALGVDLDDCLTDLDLLVTVLVEGLGDVLVVVRILLLCLLGLLSLLGDVNWFNLFVRCVM
ncbi:unnamed protein product [marine sediment metagenome]|uniref:Uncharacterized protein n=1 Tax=marine sediment metagenome TaxID=412755 RepID=X0UBT3_9ZZZZ